MIIYNKTIKKIFSKNKKYKMLLLTFILFIEIMMGVCLYFYRYNTLVLKKSFSNRLLTLISNEEEKDIIEKIENIDGVESVYPKWTNCYIKDKEQNVFIFNHIESKELKILKGKNIFELNENEILVPNTSSLKLGDTIEFQNNNIEYNFEVVGIYDNIIALNNILVSANDISRLSSRIMGRYQIVAKNYDEVKKIIDILSKADYDINIDNIKGIEMLEKNQSIIKVLIYFLVIISIFIAYILFIIINDILHENQKNIAIMKVLGYKNKEIVYLVIYNVYKIITIAALKSTIIFLLIGIIANYIIGWGILKTMHLIQIEVFTYFILLIMIFITSLYLSKKIKSLTPILLYKES